jgi:hypothetical protein
MLRSLCLTILSIKVVTINIGFQEIRYDNLEVKVRKILSFIFMILTISVMVFQKKCLRR